MYRNVRHLLCSENSYPKVKLTVSIQLLVCLGIQLRHCGMTYCHNEYNYRTAALGLALACMLQTTCFSP